MTAGEKLLKLEEAIIANSKETRGTTNIDVMNVLRRGKTFSKSILNWCMCRDNSLMAH